MKTRNSGFTLLPVLVMLSIAALICLQTAIYQSQTLQIEREEISALVDEESETEAIFDAYLGGTRSNSTFLSCYGPNNSLCIRDNKAFSSIETENNIAGVLLSDTQAFPQFNLLEIFKSPGHCVNLNPQSGNITTGGASLTERSNVAQDTCLFDGPQELGNTTFLSNLFANGVVIFKGQTIAALGYIHVSDTVVIEADTVMFAAGDIVINNLTTTNNPRLTIISTTGSIQVNNLTGSPKLKVISRLGNFVQGAYLPQDTIFMPPILSTFILSLSY